MESEVALDDLVPQLTAIAKQGLEERIFVRGDRTVDYGTVMKVMGRLNAAGFKRIGAFERVLEKYRVRDANRWRRIAGTDTAADAARGGGPADGS